MTNGRLEGENVRFSVRFILQGALAITGAAVAFFNLQNKIEVSRVILDRIETQHIEMLSRIDLMREEQIQTTVKMETHLAEAENRATKPCSIDPQTGRRDRTKDPGK